LLCLIGDFILNMKQLQKAILTLLTSLIVLPVSAQVHNKLYLWDEQGLKKQKELFRKGNKDQSLMKIITRADSALLKGPFSVTYTKTKLAPSNDAHDYLSQAPYWWPDSSKVNGEPYIRRDGRRNPEIRKLHDRTQIGDLTTTVEELAVGYYVSGNETYAVRANELLDIFFVNSRTKMNPNLTYAQYIPGLNDGRGIGIIETRGLVDIPEAVALMSGSASLRNKVVTGVRSWFADYLKWLQTSPNGKSEHLEKNNHGTNYDLQVVDFALFTGNKELAKNVIRDVTIPRLQVQFNADGRQPLETLRTNSWDYVNMNLAAWIKLGQLAEHLGINLWRQTNQKGAGIKTGVQWLLPYVKQEKKWPYEQLNKKGYDQVKFIIEVAKTKFPDLDFSGLTAELPADY